MTWADLINALVAKGLPKGKIAESIGVPPQTVSDILAGRQKSVRWEIGNELQKLCAKHGINTHGKKGKRK